MRGKDFFGGSIFYWTKCVVEIKLDKLLNAKHSSSGLRRKASTDNFKNRGTAVKLEGGEILRRNRKTSSRRKKGLITGRQ